MKTCIALAALLFATPVVAQKTRIASESLHLYDSRGQAVGHYLGFGHVSILDGTQRIEAYFPYGTLQPTDPAISFLHESVDCSGPAYNWVDQSLVGHRNGWIFQSGALIYPSGEIKTTSFLSFKYMLGNGTFGACEAIDPDSGPLTMTVAPLKILNVGSGPFTVK